MPRLDASQHRMKRRCSLSSQLSLPEPSRARAARRVTCAASEGLSEEFLTNLWERHRQHGGEPGPQPFGDRGAHPQPVPAGCPQGTAPTRAGGQPGLGAAPGPRLPPSAGAAWGPGPSCPLGAARPRGHGEARPGPAAAPPRCRRRPHSRW